MQNGKRRKKVGAAAVFAAAILAGSGCSHVPESHDVVSTVTSDASSASIAPSAAEETHATKRVEDLSPEQQATLIRGLRKRLSEHQLHSIYSAMWTAINKANATAIARYPLPIGRALSDAEIAEIPKMTRKQEAVSGLSLEHALDKIDAKYKITRHELHAISMQGFVSHWEKGSAQPESEHAAGDRSAANHR